MYEKHPDRDSYLLICKNLIEKEIENYNVWFIDNIINFSNHYYEKIEYIELFGYKVQTIKSVLKLKKQLNRSKDKKDIQHIMDFYKDTDEVK